MATIRRTFLKQAGALAAGMTVGACVAPLSDVARATSTSSNSMPEGGRLLSAAGAEFWYTDSGGDGPIVFLLHPATGSALVWEKQMPEFLARGYRVIAYSRRGHAGSSPIDPVNPGAASADFLAIVDALGVERFHIVGSAAGGFAVPDICLAAPERVLSGTIASSFGGFSDPDYRKALDDLKPEGFGEMPAWFRELGPEFRAADPQGTRRWAELEAIGRHGPRARLSTLNELSWENVAKITTPILYFTGSADLYSPPHLVLFAASHLQNCETHIVDGAGHSVYWERPDRFNALVLDFLGRHAWPS